MKSFAISTVLVLSCFDTFLVGSRHCVCRRSDHFLSAGPVSHYLFRFFCGPDSLSGWPGQTTIDEKKNIFSRHSMWRWTVQLTFWTTTKLILWIYIFFKKNIWNLNRFIWIIIFFNLKDQNPVGLNYFDGQRTSKKEGRRWRLKRKISLERDRPTDLSLRPNKVARPPQGNLFPLSFFFFLKKNMTFSKRRFRLTVLVGWRLKHMQMI